MLQKLPKNSQIHTDLLNCLINPRNESTLVQELKLIFDEIFNVKKEEESKNKQTDKKELKQLIYYHIKKMKQLCHLKNNFIYILFVYLIK